MPSIVILDMIEVITTSCFRSPQRSVSLADGICKELLMKAGKADKSPTCPLVAPKARQIELKRPDHIFTSVGKHAITTDPHGPLPGSMVYVVAWSAIFTHPLFGFCNATSIVPCLYSETNP